MVNLHLRQGSHHVTAGWVEVKSQIESTFNMLCEGLFLLYRFRVEH